MSTALPASARFEIASFGERVADPSRVAMLLSLMDGSARPASELAALAHVSPSTASAHLAKLLEGRLVMVEQLGRHRYYRIASEQVAEALEALALLQPPSSPKAPPSEDWLRIANARTCYRHLAGTIGVGWFQRLQKERLLSLHEGAIALSSRGQERFGELGLQPEKWPDGKHCLDWTERQNHLGGRLGGLLTDHLFSMRWLARHPNTRAVRITDRGRDGLKRHFAWAVG